MRHEKTVTSLMKKTWQMTHKSFPCRGYPGLDEGKFNAVNFNRDTEANGIFLANELSGLQKSGVKGQSKVLQKGCYRRICVSGEDVCWQSRGAKKKNRFQEKRRKGYIGRPFS